MPSIPYGVLLLPLTSDRARCRDESTYDAGTPSNTPISLYLIEAIDDYQGGAMAQPCPMARECTRP